MPKSAVRRQKTIAKISLHHPPQKKNNKIIHDPYYVTKNFTIDCIDYNK